MGTKKPLILLWFVIVTFSLSGCVSLFTPTHRREERAVQIDHVMEGTDLGVGGFLTIGEASVSSSTGRFLVRLRKGTTYDYTVQNALGTVSGTVTYDGSPRLTIERPPFPGRSIENFNTLLINPVENATVR